VSIGDLVFAESKFGTNFGIVISESWASPHSKHSGDILHIATTEERRQFRNKLLHEEQVIDICRQIITTKGMEMDILDAEYQWNGEKLAVFFDSKK
jgi:cell fate regulator YaaT (PSP1 superfamily)